VPPLVVPLLEQQVLPVLLERRVVLLPLVPLVLRVLRVPVVQWDLFFRLLPPPLRSPLVAHRLLLLWRRRD
jgi:hypothetical protein